MFHMIAICDNLRDGWFSCFLTCTNGTKSRKKSASAQILPVMNVFLSYNDNAYATFQLSILPVLLKYKIFGNILGMIFFLINNFRP